MYVIFVLDFIYFNSDILKINIFSLESVKYFLYCIYRNVVFNMSRFFFCLGAKLNWVVGNNSSPAIYKSSSGIMNVSQCGMDGDFQNIPAQIFPDSCS